jgi:hypothetical protein
MRQQAHDKQRNNARTARTLWAAKAAPRRQPRPPGPELFFLNPFVPNTLRGISRVLRA